MLKLLMIFVSVFLAEVGDKTQIAILLTAASGDHHPGVVFLVSSLALIVSTAIAVLLGSSGQQFLNFIPLKLIAGVGFICIGALMLGEHFFSG